MNKVWLVTDSANGLGRNIAGAVLESSDRLVSTARDTKPTASRERRLNGDHFRILADGNWPHCDPRKSSSLQAKKDPGFHRLH
jgi:NAD(P)-dependent dehydrogenase (short-subunit alcohol dehydrogenase family)